MPYKRYPDCIGLIEENLLDHNRFGYRSSRPAIEKDRVFARSFSITKLVGIRSPGFAMQNIAGFGVAPSSKISLLILQTSGGGFSRYPSAPYIPKCHRLRRVKIVGGNLQGNLPMATGLPFVKFRGEKVR